MHFNKKISHNLIEITSLELEKMIYMTITDEINHDILNKEALKDILIITKNKTDEILYVDFDLDKAYQVLDDVSNILVSSYKHMEDGDTIKDSASDFSPSPAGHEHRWCGNHQHCRRAKRNGIGIVQCLHRRAAA